MSPKAPSVSGAKRIPANVRAAVVARIEPEMERYIASGDTGLFGLEYRADYLYVSAQDGPSAFGGRSRPRPLCRLLYTGDIEDWILEMYRCSTESYDEEGDFPAPGGTPELCFSTAADFYLRDLDAHEAGATCGQRPEGKGRAGGFTGRAGLLPALAGGEFPAMPRGLPDLGEVLDGALLVDVQVFLRFIDGRTFALAPRTLGFARGDLEAANALMREPKVLHSRITQERVPRVQCCFAIAEALGLFEVHRFHLRAAGAASIEGFLALSGARQWWSILEALWHRVWWSALRPDAFGPTEAHQAARAWLGAHLASRSRALLCDERTTYQANVLESFLFPAWRDAGLLDLAFDPSMRVNPSFEARTTRLRRVKATMLGRWVFAHLAGTSPREPDRDDVTIGGGANGQRFFRALEAATPSFYYS